MSEDLSRKVLGIQHWLETNRFPGLRDAIVAYSSVTVIYDAVIVRKNAHPSLAYEWIRKKLEQAYENSTAHDGLSEPVTRIPVCYDEDFGTDLAHIRTTKNLSTHEIVSLHTSRIYRIYMLGFLPGFAYLGETDPALTMPRKETPEQVKAGSVGIVSNQTGIYPLDSPGGWHIIGRTPVRLFDPGAKVPVALAAGGHLQFYEISRAEYESHL